MGLFDDSNVRLNVLKQRAYNYRWAEVDDGVIPLTAADPDFPVAEPVRQAMIDYINGGYFSYTPKLGLPEFKQAISDGLKARKGEIIDPELILPIDSAARGMYVIARTVLAPGDEMIVFDPVDYLFRESCLAAGGKVALFPAKLKDGWIDLSDLESYITPKTRMIGLCNPHNPYGVSYRKEDLEHIMALCEKYNLYIMNDEIWSDIIFPEAPFNSIYLLGNERCRRVMSVFGWSKSFGIAGMRIGCIYTTDPALFERMVEKSDVMSTAGGISSLSQIAGFELLPAGGKLHSFCQFALQLCQLLFMLSETVQRFDARTIGERCKTRNSHVYANNILRRMHRFKNFSFRLNRNKPFPCGQRNCHLFRCSLYFTTVAVAYPPNFR